MICGELVATLVGQSETPYPVKCPNVRCKSNVLKIHFPFY
jgi:hypothetical protein